MAPDSDPDTLTRTDAQRRSDAVSSPVVRGYVIGLGLVALVLTGFQVFSHAAPDGHHWLVALPILAGSFLLSEMFPLEVEIRGGNIALPLVEVPLLLALLLAPFPVAGLAVVTAISIRAARLRQHPVIATCNLGSGLFEVVVAYLARDMLGVVMGKQVPTLALLFIALVVSSLASSLNAFGLSLAVAGRQERAARRQLALTSVTMAIAGPLVVVLVAQLLRSGPAGWALLVGVLTLFALLYRAYSVLLRERRDLDLVQDISRAVAEQGGTWPEVAELLRRQFNAARVVVWTGENQELTVAGRVLTADQALHCRPDDAVSAAAAAGAHLFTVAHAEASLADSVKARGVSEVLVAPLGTGAAAGSIELHDRQNQLRGFGAGDVALLDTLARHATTALDNRRLLAELRDAAYHDRLTGLNNRLGFIERITKRPEELGRADDAAIRQGTATVGAVLLLGLGVVGQVNDALGHAWGERLIDHAARSVRTSVARLAGPGAELARVGDDVFAVHLDGFPPDRCEEIAGELAAELSVPYPMGEFSAEATVAVGVAFATAQTGTSRDNAERMLQHADVAMQAARNSGQPVRTYHEGMGQRFLRHFQLVTQFRAAMTDGHVNVYLQPKVRLSDRSVVGAEALLRWTHPELGPVNPEELVRVLEATGLMDELTRFVLDRALAQCRALLDRGLRIAPAVNVSVRNLLSPRFPDMVSDALQRHGVDADMLTLEITETSIMGDAERTLPALRVLHEMGVRLSVDDFGTGYSSLSYLRRLPVHEIKIDKSFVLGMGTDLGDLAVVRSIIDLGRSLGLQVVAEGVESEVVRDQLAGMGCDIIQGYLVARPMNASRFDAWLHAQTVQPAADGEPILDQARLGASNVPGAALTPRLGGL